MDYVVLESPNVQRVFDMLRDTGDTREIVYKSTTELPFFRSTSGAVKATDTKIDVYINNDAPFFLQEDTIVHEILHLILEDEGYPTVDINKKFYLRQNKDGREMIDKALSIFISVIQHPEVFRRQNKFFDLDIERIFRHKVDRKVAMYKKEKPQSGYYFDCQQDILESVELPYYPHPFNDQVLEEYEELAPDSFKASQELYDRLNGLNLHDPDECREGAKVVLNYLIEYGSQHGLDAGPQFNQIWRNFRIR